jgi:hypothetical protein
MQQIDNSYINEIHEALIQDAIAIGRDPSVLAIIEMLIARVERRIDCLPIVLKILSCNQHDE